MIDMIRTIIESVSDTLCFSGKGRPGEKFVNREMFQHYGFSSRPLKDAEGIAVRQGNTVYLIAEDDSRYRVSLQNGEVALYTDEGDCVHLKRGRNILISSGGTVNVQSADTLCATASMITAEATRSAAIKAPDIKVDGPVTIQGQLSVQGNVAVTGNIAATGTVMDTLGNSNHHVH